MRRAMPPAARRRSASNLHLHPGRPMIAGLLPAARRAVDARAFERLRQCWAEQCMIDADAGVALKRVPPVVPESVDPLVGMEVADRVGPALPDQFAIFLARFRGEQGILQPALGLVDVLVG